MRYLTILSLAFLAACATNNKIALSPEEHALVVRESLAGEINKFCCTTREGLSEYVFYVDPDGSVIDHEFVNGTVLSRKDIRRAINRANIPPHTAPAPIGYRLIVQPDGVRVE